MNCKHGPAHDDACAEYLDDAINIIKDVCRNHGDTPSLMNAQSWLDKNFPRFRPITIDDKFATFIKSIEAEAQAEGPEAVKQLEDFRTYYRSKLNNGHNS